jgi:hypothetical protein
MIILRRLAAGAALACLLLAHPPGASAQESFPTPEAAAQALVDAAGHPEKGMLDRIFGPGGAALLSSGDPDTDKQRLGDFLALAGKGSTVADDKEGRKALVFGADGWRFPIPLHAVNGSWAFDLAAGRQEMTDRLVGRNELAAIGACADYVAAQNEYRASLHDDEPVQQFASRLISTPGRHDGLYWEPADATDRSPLGDRIIGQVSAGGEGQPRSYHGYVFRILTAQGPDAPGGAYDYMVKGRLLAGFALLAHPLRWGETGVMTFLCDQRGQVWERNFGKRTAEIAATIRAFDPGEGWAPLAAQN